jgi:hypothetical protein
VKLPADLINSKQKQHVSIRLRRLLTVLALRLPKAKAAGALFCGSVDELEPAERLAG